MAEAILNKNGADRSRAYLAGSFPKGEVHPAALTLLREFGLPFGALDNKLRRELRGALLEVHKRLKLTSIFVTHDHEEAFTLADRVVVLNRGAVSRDDTHDTIRRAPANDFVREFLR